MQRYISAGFILLVAVFIHSAYLPLPWPDEALFSSPAAAFASGKGLISPVLSGLIPGMDEATLWNSPLYMWLLGILYMVTGESIFTGRLLSLGLALASLVVLERIARSIIGVRRLEYGRTEFLVTIALMTVALDPTFIRSANVIRMDMLALFWMLLAINFLLHFIRSPESLYFSFLAGIAGGLAGISHPFAIIVLPVFVIFLIPHWKAFPVAFAGGLLGFSPWLIYIARYPDIFIEQFLSQMTRKSDMISLFGGDTGGIFIVFASQYGGGQIFMILFLLFFLTLYCFLFIAWIVRMLRNRSQGWFRAAFDGQRFVIVYVIVLPFILLASEGWYALYAWIFAVPALLSIYPDRLFLRESFSVFRKRPLAFEVTQANFFITAGVLFFAVNIALIYKHQIDADTAYSVDNRLADIHSLSARHGCQTIYLRTIPDPYFHLRSEHLLPNSMTDSLISTQVSPSAARNREILQFIPGKLKLANDTELRKRYDSIDCFFLNPHDSWEPHLSEYLLNHSSDFDVIPMPEYENLEDIRLVKRNTFFIDD